MTDYNRLRWDELASISEFVDTLSDDQRNTATLCGGWRVRDVMLCASLALGSTRHRSPRRRSPSRYLKLAVARVR